MVPRQAKWAGCFQASQPAALFQPPSPPIDEFHLFSSLPKGGGMVTDFAFASSQRMANYGFEKTGRGIFGSQICCVVLLCYVVFFFAHLAVAYSCSLDF